MIKSARIYIAGHTGLIGSAITRRLKIEGYVNLIYAKHAELELTDRLKVVEFFNQEKPEYVVLAAGKVGGIIENKINPANFMNENLAIQLNVLQAAHSVGIKKLIFFASSCMYPRECSQPMSEDALLSGIPEITSIAYAISKLAGMQLCLAYNQQYGEKKFIPLIPNSAYGPNDNFDPESGHVLSALIRRFHEAKLKKSASVTLWGSGTPCREFIHVDDIADASLALLVGNTDDINLPINVGTGNDISIQQLAEKISKMIGYQGTVIWDTNKPDGAPRKLLDSTRINNFGWKHAVNFNNGLKDTYKWYLNNLSS